MRGSTEGGHRHSCRCCGGGVEASNPPRHVTPAPVELNQQRTDGTQLSPDAAAKPSVFIVLLLAVALVCRRLPQRHAAPFTVFAPSNPPFSFFGASDNLSPHFFSFLLMGGRDKVLSGTYLPCSSSRLGPAAGRPGRRAFPPPGVRRDAWPWRSPERASPPSLTSALI